MLADKNSGSVRKNLLGSATKAEKPNKKRNHLNGGGEKQPQTSKGKNVLSTDTSSTENNEQTETSTSKFIIDKNVPK